MDDEPNLLEVDARLRAALAPDEAALRRVLARATGDARSARPATRGIRYAIVAAVAVVLAAGIWEWRRTPAARSGLSLTVVGKGEMVVIEAHDGRRWILGPPLERETSGHYIIAVRE